MTTNKWTVILLAGLLLPLAAFATTSDLDRRDDKALFPWDAKRRSNTGRSPAEALAESMKRPSLIPRASDPLQGLAEAMSDVVGDLAQRQTDKPVQQKQGAIVKKLDELIAQLDKASKSCSSCAGAGGGTQPTRPMPDSQLAGGPGGIGNLLAPAKGRKDLNDLSPKQRKRILQSIGEGFPAGYEQLLQDYYKRLARQQVAGDRQDDADDRPKSP